MLPQAGTFLLLCIKYCISCLSFLDEILDDGADKNDSDDGDTAEDDGADGDVDLLLGVGVAALLLVLSPALLAQAGGTLCPGGGMSTLKVPPFSIFKS